MAWAWILDCIDHLINHFKDSYIHESFYEIDIGNHCIDIGPKSTILTDLLIYFGSSAHRERPIVRRSLECLLEWVFEMLSLRYIIQWSPKTWSGVGHEHYLCPFLRGQRAGHICFWGLSSSTSSSEGRNHNLIQMIARLALRQGDTLN